MFAYRRSLLDRSSHRRQDALVQHSYFAIVRLGSSAGVTYTYTDTYSYGDTHSHTYTDGNSYGYT